jgi:hypothetical protein
MIVQLLYFKNLIKCFKDEEDKTEAEEAIQMVENILMRIDYENKNILKPFIVYNEFCLAREK